MRTKFKHFIFISVMFLFSLLLLPGYQAEAASARIKLDKTSVTLYTKGEKTVKLKATVTGSSKKVKWSSSNKKVATVNVSGKVTAKKAGKTVITAKTGKAAAKCRVTVKKETVKVTLDKTSLVLSVSGTKTATLKASVTGTNQKVIWSSSDTGVAVVDSSGIVTAKKAGSAVITAKVGKSTAKCKVTVKDSPKSVKELLAEYAGTYTPNAFAASSFYWPQSASVTLHADGSVSGYIGSKGYQKQNTVRPVKINMLNGGAVELVIVDQAYTTEKFTIYPAGVRPADYSSSYYDGHLNLNVPNLSYFFASMNGGALKLLYNRK